MKYKRISQDDVYRVLAYISVSAMAPVMAISLVELARYLTTSRYQVKKHMDSLKTNGMVELKCYVVPSEDEIYPPYWGYQLTEKGKDTEVYREAHEEEMRLIQECFG